MIQSWRCDFWEIFIFFWGVRKLAYNLWRFFQRAGLNLKFWFEITNSRNVWIGANNLLFWNNLHKIIRINYMVHFAIHNSQHSQSFRGKELGLSLHQTCNHLTWFCNFSDNFKSIQFEFSFILTFIQLLLSHIASTETTYLIIICQFENPWNVSRFPSHFIVTTFNGLGLNEK